MACVHKIIFFMVVFLTFLHPECSKSFFFPSETGNSRKKGNSKCVEEHMEEEDPKRLFTANGNLTLYNLLAIGKKDPIKRIVPEGTSFTYECCGGNSISKMIFRWGQYNQGQPSPSRLLSRVVVNTTDVFCSVSWVSDFKSPEYFERAYAEYNGSSQCVKWILTDVVKEDENTFVAAVRDDFTKGGTFRDCIPVQLKISKASPATQEPSPTASDPSQDTTTRQRPSPSGSGPSQDTTTGYRQPSPTTPEPSPASTENRSPNLEDWEIVVIVLVIVFVVIIIVSGAVCYVCKCTRNNGEGVNLKDNLHDEQERCYDAYQNNHL